MDKLASDLLSYVTSSRPVPLKAVSVVAAQLALFSRNPNINPSPRPFNAMLYLCKIAPAVFVHPMVLRELFVMLAAGARAGGNYGSLASYATRPSSTLAVTAAALLWQALKTLPTWPLQLVDAYVADALDQRLWCDDELAAPLVREVRRAFNPLAAGAATPLRFRPQELAHLQKMVNERLRHGLESGACKPKQVVAFLLEMQHNSAAMVLAARYFNQWLGGPAKLGRFVKLLVKHAAQVCAADQDPKYAHQLLDILLRMEIRTASVDAHLGAIRVLCESSDALMQTAVLFLLRTPLSLVKGVADTRIQDAVLSVRPASLPKVLAGSVIMELTLAVPQNREQATTDRLLQLLYRVVLPTNGPLHEALQKFQQAGQHVPRLQMVDFCTCLLMAAQHSQHNLGVNGTLRVIEVVACVMLLSGPVPEFGDPQSSRLERDLATWRFNVAALQARAVEWLVESALPALEALNAQVFARALAMLFFIDDRCSLQSFAVRPVNTRSSLYSSTWLAYLANNTVTVNGRSGHLHRSGHAANALRAEYPGRLGRWWNVISRVVPLAVTVSQWSDPTPSQPRHPAVSPSLSPMAATMTAAAPQSLSLDPAAPSLPSNPSPPVLSRSVSSDMSSRRRLINAQLSRLSLLPTNEATIARLLLVAFNDDKSRLSSIDAMELIETLVRRAHAAFATSHELYAQALVVENSDISSGIVQLSVLRHASLPDQQPVASAPLFWRGVLVLLCLSALNPASVGVQVWNAYPLLRCLLEMLLTGRFESFYPLPLGTQDSAELRKRRRERLQEERQWLQALQPNLLAGAHGVGRLLDPMEARMDLVMRVQLQDAELCRVPPRQVLHQLERLDLSLELGKVLRSSTNPDMFQDVLQRSLASPAYLEWLLPIVAEEPAVLPRLPVAVLCALPTRVDSTSETFSRLFVHLRSVVVESDDDVGRASVLDRLSEHLADGAVAKREESHRWLNTLLADNAMDTAEDDRPRWLEWLVGCNLPALFHRLCVHLLIPMLRALSVESHAATVSGYVLAVARYVRDKDARAGDDIPLDAIASAVSEVVSTRRLLCEAILSPLTWDALFAILFSELENKSAHRSSLLRLTTFPIAPMERVREAVATLKWLEPAHKSEWLGGASDELRSLVVEAPDDHPLLAVALAEAPLAVVMDCCCSMRLRPERAQALLSRLDSMPAAALAGVQVPRLLRQMVAYHRQRAGVSAGGAFSSAIASSEDADVEMRDAAGADVFEVKTLLPT